jgi:hypothetical protein
MEILRLQRRICRVWQHESMSDCARVSNLIAANDWAKPGDCFFPAASDLLNSFLLLCPAQPLRIGDLLSGFGAEAPALSRRLRWCGLRGRLRHF